MPSPIAVASAAFYHVECNHDQLFHSEYKRSNRTKGLKILRCFPHCCPEHIERSYCGTSLSVRVDIATPDPNGPSPDTSAVTLFARFEAVSDVSLRPGDCVEVDRIDVNTQTESNPEGPWMGGILDKPSRIVVAIQATETSEDKQIIFHPNNRSYSRWYYDWESGANKAQRLMKHALKAYIMERCAVDKDDNITDYDSNDAVKKLYRVLHVETSPEFTVISYRRAPLEQYMDGGVSPYGETTLHRLSPSGYESANSHQSRLSAASKDWRRPMDAQPAPLHPKSSRAKRPRARTGGRRMELGEGSTLLEDKLRWEYSNAATTSVSRNLALIYSFLRWAPLSVYASFIDGLVHGINGILLTSLAGSAQEMSRLNCFSKLLLNHTRSETAEVGSFYHDKRTVSGAPAPLPQGLETLLRVLADATLWLFSTDTRQWMRAFFRQHAELVLDTQALRECFVMFVQELQTRLDTHIFAQTALVNLESVAEEVIAAVYSYEYFHAKRPRVREILSGQSFAGWNAFVAQMREMYISMSSCPSIPREQLMSWSGLDFEQAHPPQNSVESNWNAEWLLDVDEAIWKPCEKAVKVDIYHISGFGTIDGDDGAVSLFALLEIISQVVRIEVGFDVQARTLHTRSTQGVAGALDCMRLVLDGKDRVFSQFPNAMATEVDAGACGDYIGEVQADESGRLVIYLQIFNWSTRGDGPSYHTRMRVECWDSHRLCISGDILTTTAPASFTPEEAVHVCEMPLRTKRDAVDASYAQQLQKNPDAGWAVFAGPWKELGRFRLGYLKV